MKITILLFLILFVTYVHGQEQDLQQQIDQVVGRYHIDTSKENLHIFKHFVLDLKIEESKINLYFVSSEDYGYAYLWNSGDIYGYTHKVKSLRDTIPLQVYESRVGAKVLTDYKLYIVKNSFKIITADNKYIDNFVKE